MSSIVLFFLSVSLFISLSTCNLCDGGPVTEYLSLPLSSLLAGLNTGSAIAGNIDESCSSDTPGFVQGLILTNDALIDLEVDLDLCSSTLSTVINGGLCVGSCNQLISAQPISQCTATTSITVFIPIGEEYHFQLGSLSSFNFDLGFSAPRPASSTGGGDPHFKGFQGQKFDFDGVEDHVYNLITDCNFQLNTRFISIRDLTFMGEIGIMTNNHKILLTPGGDISAIVDGKELNESRVYSFHEMSVEIVKDAGHVFVRMEGYYDVKVMDIPWEKYNASFHNIKVTNFGRKGAGIIGHTWEMQIEEDLEERYNVEDGLFGLHFPQNKFGECEEVKNDDDNVWIGGAQPPSFK